MIKSGTDTLYTALVAHLLSFKPYGSDDTLNSLGHKFYVGAAPDDASFPYSVIAFTNTAPGTYAALRLSGPLEIMTFHRPRKHQALTERLADMIDAAFLNYTAIIDYGLVFIRSRARQTMPVFPSPADREVVQIVQRFDLIAWPTYLTQYEQS